MDGSGWPAIEAAAGNDVRVFGYWRRTAGASPLYNANVYVEENDWVSYTPTVTTQTGSITTLGAVSARYRRRGRTVEWFASIAVTTNGTGAGDVRVTLPAGMSPITDAVGQGREMQVNGNMLQALFLAATSFVTVNNYANAYPAADGCRLVLSGQYEIA